MDTLEDVLNLLDGYGLVVTDWDEIVLALREFDLTVKAIVVKNKKSAKTEEE